MLAIWTQVLAGWDTNVGHETTGALYAPLIWTGEVG